MIILGSLKARSGLPIGVNWTIFATCYGWGVTSEYRLKIGVCGSTRSVWPKISGRRSHPHNHSSCKETRMNDLSCDIRMWAQVSFVLSQSTRLTDGQTDRQTDRQKGIGNTVRCITGSRTVKAVLRRLICSSDFSTVGTGNFKN